MRDYPYAVGRCPHCNRRVIGQCAVSNWLDATALTPPYCICIVALATSAVGWRINSLMCCAKTWPHYTDVCIWAVNAVQYRANYLSRMRNQLCPRCMVKLVTNQNGNRKKENFTGVTLETFTRCMFSRCWDRTRWETWPMGPVTPEIARVTTVPSGTFSIGQAARQCSDK